MNYDRLNEFKSRVPNATFFADFEKNKDELAEYCNSFWSSLPSALKQKYHTLLDMPICVRHFLSLRLTLSKFNPKWKTDPEEMKRLVSETTIESRNPLVEDGYFWSLYKEVQMCAEDVAKELIEEKRAKEKLATKPAVKIPAFK